MGKKVQLDFASIIGLLLAPICVLGGQWIEGGALGSLVQLSAAMIVIGASIGACMLSFAPSSLMAAARDVRKVIASTAPDPFELIDRIVAYSNVLGKEGPIALQKQVAGETYPLLNTALNLLVSNMAPEALLGVLERRFAENFRHNSAGADVFDAAGGYLPTFGIMGAVLGLIHTMSMLDDPSKIGSGIATAFVATLYGVGSANILAYPFSKKIRARAQTEKELDRIVITAFKAILSGQKGLGLRQTLTGGSVAPSITLVKKAEKGAA